MTEKQQVHVKCPFFLDSHRFTIECESLIGSAAMLTRFPTIADLTAHVARYCMKEDGGRCPLAMNLYDKYRRLEALADQRAKDRHDMYLKPDD